MRASLLGLIAVLAGIFLSGTARATTAPVILSLSYGSYAPSQYIGTTLTVNVTAVQPTAQFSVSVTADTAGAGGSVTLGGLFTGAIPTSTPLYISDGIRTWEVTWVTADGDSITIDSGNMLGSADSYTPLGWAVSDYSLFANTTFQVYAGTLVTNAVAGASVTVNVGQFAQVVLYDNATNGDAYSGDGIWTGQFKTPNTGTTVTNAYFYGSVSVENVGATNQNYQSAQYVSYDMELPAFTVYSQSTTNTNYDGDLYLSSLCQTLDSTVPSNVQPSSAQAQFNFTVNKPNTVVNITIGSTPPYQLPPFIIPNGATSLSGWSVWNGIDGNLKFLPDGIYPVSYYINDTNGLTGVTVTSSIKVVSLHINITGISMTPPVIASTPPVTDGVITSIGYTETLSNDSGTNLNSSLKVLGWSDAGSTFSLGGAGTPTVYGINSLADPFSTVWTMQTEGTLNPEGQFTQFSPGQDNGDDDNYLAEYVFYPYLEYANSSQPALPAWAEICNYGGPGPISAYNDNFAVGTAFIEGDGIVADDWRPKGLTAMGDINGITPPLPGNGLFVTSTAGGPNLNPITIGFQRNFNWIGATPAVGNYRLDLQSVLTGLAFTAAIGSGVPDVVDPCSPTAAATLLADAFHFFPQIDVDDTGSPPAAYGGPPQGDQLKIQNTSAIFSVQATTNPTGDNTPPEYLSSNPAQNSTVQPNVYSGTSPLSVEFQDLLANFNTGQSFSYITVTGPDGSGIEGISSTNGGNPDGTLTIYFTPSDPLGGSSGAPGGNYTMQAFTCNVDGLCAEQSIPFTVQDTTAPALQANGVILVTQSGTQIPLSVFQNGAQGPYQNIAQISVNIQMPNPTTQNTIDYGDSNVSLYQISGTSQSPVSMTRLPDSNVTTTQGTLNYAINSVINYAGLFQVQTQTYGVDKSGTRYPGPAALSNGTNEPEFTTTLCTVCVDIPYSNNPNVNWPAVTGEQPVTVTSGGVIVPLASIGASKPVALPADSGYAFLTTVAGTEDLQFTDGGVPMTTPLKWAYPITTPLTFQLYYTTADLAAVSPSAVAATSLSVAGYNGTNWQTVSGVTLPTSPTAGNIACVIPVPDNGSTLAYEYYALVYPSALSTPGPTSTPPPGSTPTPQPTSTPPPTPISLLSTRAFDPWNSNPLYQKARFYYSAVAPASMEARVYDTSGGLIRDLTLGNGISASESAPTDSAGDVEFYFTWDGTNSAGTVVHNGIYLVRWTETGIDGSHNTLTRPVALIK